MPCHSCAPLHDNMRLGWRSTILLQGWPPTDKAEASLKTERDTAEDWHRSPEILWTQFLHWGGHNSSQPGGTGLVDQNHGPLGKCDISVVCADPSGAAGGSDFNIGKKD